MKHCPYPAFPCHTPVMAQDSTNNPRPWSARRPQSIVLSIVLIAVAVVLVIQGFAYVRNGVGGIVPYLIILGGPALAAYYVWYFNFYRFDGTKS
jgi:hypothetical protein